MPGHVGGGPGHQLSMPAVSGGYCSDCIGNTRVLRTHSCDAIVSGDNSLIRYWCSRDEDDAHETVNPAAAGALSVTCHFLNGSVLTAGVTLT